MIDVILSIMNDGQGEDPGRFQHTKRAKIRWSQWLAAIAFIIDNYV